MIKETALLSADRDGPGRAAGGLPMPEENPFMAGAFHGVGEPDCVINTGVSGPGAVKRAVESPKTVILHPGGNHKRLLLK